MGIGDLLANMIWFGHVRTNSHRSFPLNSPTISEAACITFLFLDIYFLITLPSLWEPSIYIYIYITSIISIVTFSAGGPRNPPRHFHVPRVPRQEGGGERAQGHGGGQGALGAPRMAGGGVVRVGWVGFGLVCVWGFPKSKGHLFPMAGLFDALGSWQHLSSGVRCLCVCEYMCV